MSNHSLESTEIPGIVVVMRLVRSCENEIAVEVFKVCRPPSGTFMYSAVSVRYDVLLHNTDND